MKKLIKKKENSFDDVKIFKGCSCSQCACSGSTSSVTVRQNPSYFSYARNSA